MSGDPTDPSAPRPSPEPSGDAAGDRRTSSDRRAGADRRQRQVPVAVDRRSGVDRRQQADRRRGMNQYDLGAEELEFIRAINRFKERTGKSFPTWSDVLGIIHEMGYERRRP